jgi:hypothetical protein
MTEPTSVDGDTALPSQVAAALFTTEAGLAQMRYRGTGPRFVKRGRRVLYRWSDVRAVDGLAAIGTSRAFVWCGIRSRSHAHVRPPSAQSTY